MKILMITSEAVPFCKSGGLADVAGSLSEALNERGEDARVLLPLYGMIDRTGITDSKLTLKVKVEGRTHSVKVYQKKVAHTLYYFLSDPVYTKRGGIYGENSFAPYPDNLTRYTLLDKAAFELCKALDFKPDILHAHDWPAGLVPYMLKIETDPFFKNTKSVITIHNLAYQGEFTRLDLLGSDLPPADGLFKGEGPDKRCNMLKAGLTYADRITTVSPTYAKEIQDKKYGCGLHELLSGRKDKLTGIINGIDYKEWNPETDPLIPYHFTKDDLSGKALLKKEVQKKFGLPEKPDTPLFAMISRIAEQKGFQELLTGSPCVLEKIIQQFDLQMVIIGTGDKQMEDSMKALAEKYPEKLSVNIMFSNSAAHLVEAGADYFFMPSRFEPCGLNQLYSLRYGTLPIARSTGGLADTIDHGKTGYLFAELTEQEMLDAISRALRDYPDLDDMRKSAMEQDFTWNQSACFYIDTYRLQ